MPTGISTPVRCIDCDTPVSKKAYRCDSCGRSEVITFKRAIGAYGKPGAEGRRRRYNRRNRLDAQAAGPWNRKHRPRLLAKWRKQGKRCAYCLTGPADQVDHVIPLSRGGTNHEGNLVPACDGCNHAKWDNLLSAWRHGRSRKPPKTWVDDVPRPPRKALVRSVDQSMLKSCLLCGVLAADIRLYCSRECQLEANARRQRDRYRASVGLPVDPSAPTKPRSRRVGSPRALEDAA